MLPTYVLFLYICVLAKLKTFLFSYVSLRNLEHFIITWHDWIWNPKVPWPWHLDFVSWSQTQPALMSVWTRNISNYIYMYHLEIYVFSIISRFPRKTVSTHVYETMRTCLQDDVTENLDAPSVWMRWHELGLI